MKPIDLITVIAFMLTTILAVMAVYLAVVGT